MLPLITPPSDSDVQLTTRRRVKLAVVAAVLGVVIALVIGQVDTEQFQRTILPILVGMSVTAPLAIGAFIYASRNQSRKKTKRKREGTDMYTLIDRLVDDLDDDETAYLQRRLDDREHGFRDDLAESAEDLLLRRAEDRQKGLRE